MKMKSMEFNHLFKNRNSKNKHDLPLPTKESQQTQKFIRRQKKKSNRVNDSVAFLHSLMG